MHTHINKIDKNIPLSNLNTFGSDYFAKYYISISKIEKLYDLINTHEIKDIPKLVLGGGSNVLFTRNFDGLVIKLCNNEISIIKEDISYVWLQVDAGIIWHEFVLFCIKNGYGGVENLSLIPGTVGGSPVSNIGAYGVEVSSTVEEVHALDLISGDIKKFNNSECSFGYRKSLFKENKKYLVTNVVFRLEKHPNLVLHYGSLDKELHIKGILNPTIKDVSDLVISIRQSKLPDPKKISNAGSFFKNPIISKEKYEMMKSLNAEVPGYIVSDESIKVPAAWLIEDCGWKGKRIGNVGVSPGHALVLVRYSEGTGLDVYELSKRIQDDVYSKWDIKIEPEVEIY